MTQQCISDERLSTKTLESQLKDASFRQYNFDGDLYTPRSSYEAEQILKAKALDIARALLDARALLVQKDAEIAALKAEKAARENAGHYRGGSFDPS